MDTKDLKDILGITNDQQTPSISPPAKKQKTTKPKKPAWISREVYSLLDEKKLPLLSLPITPVAIKPKFKGKAQKWVWKDFNSSARKDGMTFGHWVKASDVRNDYYYSQFNFSIDIPSFEREEYDLYLQDEEWTFEETQYFFELCRTFDLRFQVIHDRYSYQKNDNSGSTNRSIENLKARYYSILMKMIETPQLRKKYNVLGTDSNPSNLKKATSLVFFDEKKETERKRHLEQLYNRTSEEIKEEEMLLFELERIKNQKRILVREREMVLKNLIPFEETVPTIVSAEPNIPEPQSEKKNTSRDNPIEKKPETSKKESVENKRVVNLLSYKNLVEAETELIALPNSTKQALVAKRDLRLGSGAFLRSEKITPVAKPRIEQVQLVLDHLNVACSNLAWPRPFMPTPAICDKFEKLQGIIIPLLDLKKICDKTEAELCILEKRKRMLIGDLGEDRANAILKSIPPTLKK